MLYTIETTIADSCGTDRIGLPTLNFEKAKGKARDASVFGRRVYVFGVDGCTYAVFEGANELPPDQW